MPICFSAPSTVLNVLHPNASAHERRSNIIQRPNIHITTAHAADDGEQRRKSFRRSQAPQPIRAREAAAPQQVERQRLEPRQRGEALQPIHVQKPLTQSQR